MIEREQQSRRVPGRDLFVLYDTHGLPPELAIEVAAARGYAVDQAGFEAEMAAQRERSQGEATFAAYGDERAERYAALGVASEFVGYDALTARSNVAALVAGEAAVQRLRAGQTGEVVLPQTPFYAESGGQVGDRGELVGPGGRFRVDDTQQLGGAIVHRGAVVAGALAVGDAVAARVDAGWRAGCRRNHTATHLLHAALRRVLGQHVRQAGSLVAPDRLRFDYSHPQAPGRRASCARCSASCTRRSARTSPRRRSCCPTRRPSIAAPSPSSRTATPRTCAWSSTARRAADASDHDQYQGQDHSSGQEHAPQCFSRELCGGTHLHSTGAVGSFVVVADSSIGAGLRRIEALSGPGGRALHRGAPGARQRSYRSASRRRPPSCRRASTRSRSSSPRSAAARAASRRASRWGQPTRWCSRPSSSDDVRVLVARVEAESQDALRAMGDRLREQLGSSFILLGGVIDAKPALLALASDDVVERGLRADEVVQQAGAVVGGGGGGRPGSAQAGGRDPGRLDEALEVARQAARERLGSA